MKLRTLTSVKHNGSWIKPGAVRDFDDDDAKLLVAKKAAEPVVDEMVAEAPEDDEARMDLVDALCEIEGVNTATAERLIDAGFRTPKDVYEAEPEALVDIKGIGARSVETIQESAEEIVDAQGDVDDD